MKTLRITIDIDDHGRLSADAEGFEGDACVDAIGELLDGLGSEVVRVERKADQPQQRATVRRANTVQTGRKR